ncbi:hypothetical protein ACLWBD_07440 [Bdellovibrio sp. HCB117]|uniref:hypothetical protein n=1 Tax=Bdellovibrio sp. HCB117 TaxID=3394359 RepID=UPI0039B6D39E
MAGMVLTRFFNTKNLLPLFFYLMCFLFFNAVGVYLAVWGPAFYRQLYILNSGVSFLALDENQKTLLLQLMVWPVVGFVGGYLLILFFLEKVRDRVEIFLQKTSKSRNFSEAEITTLLLSLILAGISVARAGSFSMMSTWFSNYTQWIAARYHLFEKLSSPEFINLYVIVPSVCSIVAIRFLKLNKSKLLAAALVSIAVTLSAMLFQKRPILICFQIVFIAYLLEYLNASVIKKIIIAGVASILLYWLLIFLPTLAISETNIQSAVKYKQKSSVANEFEKKWNLTEEQIAVEVEAMEAAKSLPDSKKRLLAPVSALIFRVSYPSVFYVAAYPDVYPHYGLDLVFNKVKWTDNTDVWKLMWPHIENGSVAAPMQFVFYAQAGVWAAVGMSILTGIILAFLWWWSSIGGFANPLRAVQGSLVLLLAVFISMDSLRNSLLATYGIVWGVLLLELLVWIKLLVERMNKKAV